MNKVPPKRLGLKMWRTILINSDTRPAYLHQPDERDFCGTLFTLSVVLIIVVGAAAAYQEPIRRMLEKVLGV